MSNVYDSIKKRKCPNCGEMAEAEGVDVGVGYYYPPLHCFHCGWTEENCLNGSFNESCKNCTEYEKCLHNEWRKVHEFTL